MIWQKISIINRHFFSVKILRVVLNLKAKQIIIFSPILEKSFKMKIDSIIILKLYNRFLIKLCNKLVKIRYNKSIS